MSKDQISQLDAGDDSPSYLVLLFQTSTTPKYKDGRFAPKTSELFPRWIWLVLSLGGVKISRGQSRLREVE
jgi:hypothetical protein